MARRKHPHLVATRLTTEQRDTTVFAASLDGITVTEFIRRALLPVVRARISQATSLRTASVARDETMAAKEVTTRDASGSVGSAVSHASAANPALGEVQRLVDELVDALEGAKGQGTDIAIEPLTSVRVETKVLRRRLENLCKAIGARAS